MKYRKKPVVTEGASSDNRSTNNDSGRPFRVPPCSPASDREAEYRRVFLEVAMRAYCNRLPDSILAVDALHEAEHFITRLRKWDKKEGK